MKRREEDGEIKPRTLFLGSSPKPSTAWEDVSNHATSPGNTESFTPYYLEYPRAKYEQRGFFLAAWQVSCRRRLAPPAIPRFILKIVTVIDHVHLSSHNILPALSFPSLLILPLARLINIPAIAQQTE